MAELCIPAYYVLVELEDWIARRGEAPAYRELAKALGYTSNSPIQRHLDSLEKAGYIARDRLTSGRVAPRGLRVVRPSSSFLSRLAK